MKCLVTGGCGFIGSHLVRELVERGEDVRVLDDLSSGRREHLAGLDADLRVADLRDEDALSGALAGIEVVFHQAAVPSVPRSLREPERTFSVNVGGTHRLLLAARAAGVRRVVIASSSSVYGDAEALPKHEELPPRPRSPYAAQKASCEALARAFSESLGLETVCLRYFNVYGPRQDPQSPYAAVVPAFVVRALRGETAEIHGDGEQTRDFTFVGDVVRANLRAAEAPGVAGAVINVAGGREVRVLDLHAQIARLTGTVRPPVHAPPRAGDVRRSLACIERAAALLDWRPEVSLAEGLARTIAALREELSPR
ncbi:MAG: NAD-dependent epimerase/dehydratase family protein [Planctomycetota bacterium]|nr:MAG: NAD-dependent epimerase/dehydratase family protein [Planctomycetota bacterium]